MVIGIDIDETITNTHDEAYKYVKKYAPNLEFNDYCDIKNKDVKAFLEKHAYNIQSNLTLKPYVKEAFSMFKEQGFKIVIITARGYDLDYEYERASIDMLKKYDLPYNEEMIKGIRERKVVGIILNDNSLAVSQQPVIRSNYVKPVLHMLSTLMQIINTAMYGNADHNLIQIENEGELDSINEQIEAINFDILRGKRFTPIVGKLPINPIKTSNTANLEGLFETFNSLTNFLKSITGIANSGVFDKKAHLLQEEQKLNGSNSDDIYYNGLRLRQEFCLMIQAYYGYPIWCQSKRAMTEGEEENIMLGETSDPDNTQYNDGKEGEYSGTT